MYNTNNVYIYVIYTDLVIVHHEPILGWLYT